MDKTIKNAKILCFFLICLTSKFYSHLGFAIFVKICILNQTEIIKALVIIIQTRESKKLTTIKITKKIINSLNIDG